MTLSGVSDTLFRAVLNEFARNALARSGGVLHFDGNGLRFPPEPFVTCLSPPTHPDYNTGKERETGRRCQDSPKGILKKTVATRQTDDSSLAISFWSAWAGDLGGSQARPRRKAVRFAPTLEVYNFPRQLCYDRFPSDARGLALGLARKHSSKESPPLIDEHPASRPRSRSLLQRAHLLLPFLQRRAMMDDATIVALTNEINVIVISREYDCCGCYCIDVCQPESCQCMQTGIPCFQGTDDRKSCQCCSLHCPNVPDLPEAAELRKRQHYDSTFSRLVLDLEAEDLCGNYESTNGSSS
ncbi:hypothetical protein ACOMHN_007234 [Nucella lapillus]